MNNYKLNANIKNFNKNKKDSWIKKDLSKLSTMKIGPIINNFIYVTNKDSLIKAIKYCKEQNIDFHIVGECSNIVFANSVKSKAIISMRYFNNINLNNNILEINSGSLIAYLANLFLLENIDIFQNFHLLPGSIGGAIYMNARCYNDNVSNYIHAVESYNLKEDKMIIRKKNDLDFAYKKSIFQSNQEIITKIFIKNNFHKILDYNKELQKYFQELQINSNNKIKKFYKTYRIENLINFSKINKINLNTSITDNMKEIEESRCSKNHFLKNSSGSSFKNNYNFGTPTGQLVDNLGLKGLKSGDIQISNFHGNIIINNGNGTLKDLEKIINIIQKQIYEKYDFKPELEMKILR